VTRPEVAALDEFVVMARDDAMGNQGTCVGTRVRAVRRRRLYRTATIKRKPAVDSRNGCDL
jgi:2-methylisocitrate lyase-like PEP mutase family enzyme